MTDFLSFFFPKAKVIEEPIDPREETPLIEVIDAVISEEE
tara:strand:+ start:333 stop:452 length:120 start_codon:yes stop_codon:yes gene_type:complete